MDNEVVNDLFQRAVSLGYKKNLNSFVQLLHSDSEVFNDSYSYVTSQGYSKNQNDFSVLIGKQQKQPAPIKKKATPAPSDAGQLLSQKIASQSNQQLTTDIAQFQQDPTAPPTVLIDKGRETYVAPVIKEIAKPKPITIAEFNEQIKAKEAQDRLNRKPETPYYKGELGEAIRSIPVLGNAIDDIGRAVNAGLSNGDIVTPVAKIMTNGKKATKEQINQFISSVNKAQSLEPSDEMKDFSKTYQDGGSDIFSFIKALSRNPGVAPEIMISSFFSTLNPASGAAAGTVIGGAAGYGALATPEFGGVGAVPAAIASLPYAMAASNTVLETSLTFSELLQDELTKKNLEFTEDNVRKVLEDDKILNSIRNKSLKRGGTIGVVDALTGRIAGRVGADLIGNTSASRIKSTLAATGIEMTGGMAGEAAGRAVAGQKMDVAEIGLEGIGEGPSAIVSVASEVLSRPSYKVNGEITTEANVKQIIDTATPEELSGIKIDIKNDKKGYSSQIQEKVLAHQIKQEVKQVNPDLNEESLDEITKLEQQLRNLESNKTQVAKDKAAEIKSQIKTIQDNAIQEQTTGESMLRTEQPEVGLQEVGEGDQVTEVVTEEAKSKEEVLANENTLSSFLDNEMVTSIETKLNTLFPISEDSGFNKSKVIAERYMKAKQDGSNPELVNAVEELVSLKIQPEVVTEEAKPKEEVVQEQLQQRDSTKFSFDSLGRQPLNLLEVKAKEIQDELDSAVGKNNTEDVDLYTRQLNAINKQIELAKSEQVVSKPVANVDLLGDKKPVWMIEVPESDLNASNLGYNVDSIKTIEDATQQRIRNNKKIPSQMELAIKEGRITIEDATNVIKSAGLKLPEFLKPKGEVTIVEEAKPVVNKELERLDKEIQSAEIYIENQQEEIENEKSNLKEEKARIKQEIAEVRKSKLSKEEREDRIDELNAELEDMVDDHDSIVETYKEDIAEGKRDLKKLNKQLEKLNQKPAPVANEAAEFEELLRKNRLSNPYERATKSTAAQIENHRRLALLARRALAKVAPDVKIILHETPEAYDAAVPKPSQGYFDFANNTIHINLQYAGIETVPHEVFHAILAIKIKTDPRATQVTKEMMESVMKVLDKDSPVYKQIEKLASTYEDSLKDEERLSELFGILSINYEKLPVPAKNAIVRFIEKIAKLFGLDAGKIIGRTDNSVINLLNTLSEKVAKGEEIQESEISMLGKGGDGTRTSMFKAKADNISEIVKLGRANGISEEAIATVLESRGFTEDEISKVLSTELGAKKTVDITEDMLPGMDALMGTVNAMIKRQQSKNVTNEKIAENVKKLMEKSDAYNNATDVQKEKLIRDANKIIGIKEKSAPSVARVKEGVATRADGTQDGFKRFFGQVRPEKTITATEKTLLAKQIKDTATGAKDAKKAFMTISKELTKSIKELANKGTISVKQAAAALRKLSGVNVFDQVSIDRFVEYMSKTFENAEYAEKISNAMAKLPNARKNIKTKIGIAESLTPPLTTMLALNPSIIPDSVLDSYVEIVNMIGERKEVLALEEVNALTKRVNDILDAVNIEASLADELAERFDSYEGKVFDEDGKLNYAETVKAMLKDEAISDYEAEVMRKYKSSIVPPVESVKMTEEELAEEKENLIEAIQMSDVNAEELPTREERDLANQLSELIKTKALGKLSNNQLKNLFKTIDNINNGYLTHYAQLMVEKMNAINKSVSLVSGIKSASLLPISKLYSNLKSLLTKKNPVSELIRRIPLINIDQQLGNYKDKTVFNAVFEKAAESESAYKSAISKIQHKLSDAQEAVAKSFNNDGNKTLMSSFKMMAYMVQLEYNSNLDSKQVNQAADYLRATIKHIDDGKSQFGESDANMLQEILNKYTDETGQIDSDKLYSSFNNAEKSAIKTVREINESLTEKAVYTASIIRGDKISTLNNYVHLNVLQENLPTDNIAGVSSMEQYNNSLKPSTKAKSLIERSGKVAPINFDVFASAQRGSNFVLMDYYLTEPIRTARKTFNEATASMESEGRIPKEQRDILNAVNNAFEEVVSNILTNNFVETSIAEDVVTAMTKQGYRAILGSTTRFVSELSSNIAYAMNDPKTLSTGVKLMSVIMGPDAVDIMSNLNSKQTNRIFQGDTLSGRLIDTSTMNQVSGIKGGKGKGVVANKLQQIYNNSLKKYKNFVELTADALISTPDKMVMRPIWFGSFANEFEKLTGMAPDFDKIAENDEDYIRDNKESLDKARDVADSDSVMAGSTENPFMGILKGTVKPNQSGWIRGFNTFNNFMTKFMIFEYVTARTAVNAAIGNGSIPKSRGVALLAGVTSRMIVYTLLSQYLGNGLVGLFSDDEDEEEDDKSFMQKLGQSIASAATGLIIGRDYGNAVKSVVNFGVEKMNEEYLDFLRNGDYDPYKDAIQYSVIANDPKKSKFDVGSFVMKLGGPLGPAMQTAALTAKKLVEEPKKETEAIARSENEIGTRIPLEILGNAGLIPLYKDVRKIVLADIYKDLNNAKKSVTKKDIEKSKLQGYSNREDMKRYDPELYESTYGEGSVGYDEKQAEREIKKAQESIDRKMKDDFYNYRGSSKGGFGSKKFGGGGKSSKGGFGSKSNFGG